MRKPLKPWDETTQMEVLAVLTAIAEGNSFEVHDDRLILVEDPWYDGDPSKDRYIAADTASLFENGTVLDPTLEDLEMLESEEIDPEDIEIRIEDDQS